MAADCATAAAQVAQQAAHEATEARRYLLRLDSDKEGITERPSLE
jgi:hypothetical protein